ncbi:MAG: NADH-quinone oxidoreductase subunit N [Caldilineae bacterium]|nr:NADH-quinone oxidoreductase subunit N [Caldilineae bacterium]
MPNLDSILIHFSPELVLALGALVVLLYDIAIRGRDGRQAQLTLVALVLALGATFWLWGQPPLAIFEARGAAGGAVVRPGAFISDGYTHFFRLIGLLTTLLVVLSGMVYLRGRTPFKGEFYALLLCAVMAMNLMAGANDLIVVALAIEFLSITSYVLTAFLRSDPASIEAGLKYFLYGSVTSAAMLFGISLIYGVAGTTSLTPAYAPEAMRTVAGVLAEHDTIAVAGLESVLLPAIMLVLAGVGFKIALVPFHQWSPDAYEGAPTPVTAFLSVGPKAAGFAVLLRLMTRVFGDSGLMSGWMGMIGLIAILTMVLGNIAALTQSNVKRLMAYSSIAQAGYMLVGLAAYGQGQLAGLDPLGSTLLFLLAYIFTNLGAFAIIIAIDHAAGSSELEAFSGLMKRSPFLAIALAVFLFSLIGIPPLSGFVGKFAVFGSAVAAGQIPLAVIGVLTGVISVVYYFRILREAFFGQPVEGAGRLTVAPSLTFVVAVALVMTFAIGLAPGAFVDMANQAAALIAPAGEMLAGH